MSADSYRDGQLIDAGEAAKVKCPMCGDVVGLDAEKAHEGVDHPDCQLRFGLSAPAPQTQYRLTINRLEVPIRTFEEDKKHKQEEAKESQKEKESKTAAEKEEQQQQKQHQKSKAGGSKHK